MEKLADRNNRKVSNIQIGLFGFYIFLSFFETYLTRFVGSSTKYYLLIVLALFLSQVHFRVRINQVWVCFLAWFMFKLLSIAWSNMSNSDFSTHLVSQIGMVLFVLVMTGREQDERLLSAIIKVNLWVSFLFGVLSIVFRGSYIDERYVARQVLTLFGLQNDPNNCAAFLLIAIALALYSAVIERERILLNSIIIAVNTFALMLTSSRAGFVTLGVILLCLFFFPKQEKAVLLGKTIKKTLLVVCLGVVMVVLIQRYLPQVNMNRLLIWSDYEGGSGRDIRWQKGLELFMQRPIFGWGWGGYDTGVGAIHNTFLTSLCDIGIVGTAMFVTPLLFISVDAFRQKYNLAFLVFITGVFPALMLDVINKRFFWNAIVFSTMMLLYKKKTNKEIGVWKPATTRDYAMRNDTRGEE